VSKPTDADVERLAKLIWREYRKEAGKSPLPWSMAQTVIADGYLGLARRLLKSGRVQLVPPKLRRSR
jgi:hypothetical protein